MRHTMFMATLMVIALIATACGGQAAAPTAPATPANPPTQPKEQPMSGKDTLDGTNWILTTLNGQPALKDTTVTLNFEAGRAAGSDGCNRYTTSTLPTARHQIQPADGDDDDGLPGANHEASHCVPAGAGTGGHATRPTRNS